MVSLIIVSVTGREARYLTYIVSCGSSLPTFNGATLLLVPFGGGGRALYVVSFKTPNRCGCHSTFNRTYLWFSNLPLRHKYTRQMSALVMHISQNLSVQAVWADSHETLILPLEGQFTMRSATRDCSAVCWTPEDVSVPVAQGVWDCLRQWRTEGRGASNPPPPKFRRPSKIVPYSIRLWKLLKIAEFRTPTPQDVRKKAVKL